MSRVLKTGENRITQSYESHVAKVNAGTAWARGVDVVKAPSQIDDIVAHSDGTVVKIIGGQKNGTIDSEGMGYGNYVMIAHNNNVVTLYAHMESVAVNRGQAVKKGQTIGKMGNTGNSFGAHLHFEVRQYNTDPMNVDIKGLHNTAIFKWLDPTPYLDADLPNQKVDVQPTTDNIYRVQVGAFEYKSYAVRRANEVKGKGFDACLKFYEGNYHVQVGAYDWKWRALLVQTQLKIAGYKDAFITNKTGQDVAF